MKIGFNYNSIAKLNNNSLVKNPNDYLKMIKKVEISDNIKKIFKSLVDDNHEVFIFTPSPVELPEKLKVKMKKRLVKRLKREGLDFSKLAIVDESEMVEVAKRNHIDIAIDNNQEVVNKLNEFTDAINFSNDKTVSSLYSEIIENIDKNRQSVIDYNSKPQGLPSEDQLWMKHYRVGDLKWSKDNMSPYDRLYTSNIDWKDEISMEFFGKKFTYGDFFKEVDELCNKMLSNGIGRGVRVPIVFVNTPESIITLYALYKAKATIVPIFPLSTVEDFKNKIESINRQNKEDGFDCNCMFMSDLVCGRFKDVIPSDTKVVVLPITNSMPKPLGFAFNKIVMPKMGIKKIEFNDQFISYNNYEGKDNVDYSDLDTSFDNDYTAVQLYTGGTIKPKGVMLSEGNIDTASKQFFNDRFAFRRGDKIAAFMPLNHSFGLIIGTHVAATLGVDLDLIMKINFKRLDKLFLKDKVNLFGGIPNMFPAIRNNKHMKDADLSHVKYILSGGAPIDETEKKRTNEFFEAHNSKAEIHDGYGQTESSGGIIYDGVPNIGTNVKIVEPGTTNEIGYEQLGELCMTGPQIMRGYDEEELTANALKEHADGKIWLHTGDSAIIHNDGKVEIIGRLDRMIKVNGEQVILDKLEEEINSLPFIEKSAVVKRPDDIRGYVPVAFITLKQGYTWNQEIENAMNSFYEQKLTGYARPRKTEVLEELPVTAVGKVNIKELEKMAIEQLEKAKTI